MNDFEEYENLLFSMASGAVLSDEEKARFKELEETHGDFTERDRIDPDDEDRYRRDARGEWR